MIRKPISRKFEIALIICSVLLMIGFYSMLSYKQHRLNPSDTTVPNFKQLFEGFQKLLHEDKNGNMWLFDDTKATISRLFVGLAVGVSSSFFIGLSMGVFYPVEAIFRWPITLFSKIPPTAMLAIYFVLFGTDFNMYVAMIALGIFPALTVAIFSAVRTDVYDYEIFKAYTLGLSNIEVIWEVVVQKILPRIIDNVRLVIGPAMVFLIAAEWMTADVGFGYRLRIQSRLLNMNIVYIYLSLLAVFGFSMDWSLATLRKTLCPWFDFSKN